MGSNIGVAGEEPRDLVIRAARVLDRLGVASQRSRLYASPAWPDPADPAFVNAVLSLRTSLGAEDLLAACQDIERRFGRRRERDPAQKNRPRTLDLDVIDYARLVSDDPDLTLPHPRMADRDFVLLPLRDVAPDYVHPRTGRSLNQMIADLGPITAVPLNGQG